MACERMISMVERVVKEFWIQGAFLVAWCGEKVELKIWLDPVEQLEAEEEAQPKSQPSTPQKQAS